MSPGGGPWGGPGSCSGFPSGEKHLRIRPRRYLFMLRSILILPDLEILLKSQKVSKLIISKHLNFQQSVKHRFAPMKTYSFSCRVRIQIQNWTITVPKPDFDLFLKISNFIKNSIFITCWTPGPGAKTLGSRAQNPGFPSRKHLIS